MSFLFFVLAIIFFILWRKSKKAAKKQAAASAEALENTKTESAPTKTGFRNTKSNLEAANVEPESPQKSNEGTIVTVTSEQRTDPNIEEELREYWEEYHKEAARLDAENKEKIAAIDFSKVVPGNDDEELSALEVEFLEYLNRKKINELKIARRWVLTNIDYQAKIEKFFRCGLLTFETAEAVLSAQKVAELKAFLQEQNLNITGNKDALIKGILEFVPAETVSAHYPPSRLCLTEKATSIIDSKKKCDLDEKFRAASLSSHEHLKAGELPAYRDDLMSIVEVYMDEERYQSALRALMMVFVLDASGAPTPELIRQNQEYIREGWIEKGTFLSYHPTIEPYPMRMIDKAISELNLSMQEVEEIFRDEIHKEQIPYKFCSVDEMADLFMSAVSGDERADELVEIYKKRFTERYGK